MSDQSRRSPERHVAPELDTLAREGPVVLIFLPNTNELQRFVWSGAFAELSRDHQLRYVLPEEDAAKMLGAAAPMITPDNSATIRVAPERFKKWSEVFQAACVHYAGLSPSFAIRAQMVVEPGSEFSSLSAERQQELDREFDAKVATILHGMQPLPEIVELFDRFKPVYCIMPTSLLDLFCNEVVWACEAERVSCVILQSGWDNLSSKGLLRSGTAFLGCWGPQSLDHATLIQRMRPKRIVPLGAPHYEFLKRAPAGDVPKLRAQLGVAEDERLILFGGSFRQFDETSTLLQLDRAIARGRLGPARIVYRPHPWRAGRQHEESFFTHEWRHVTFDPDMRERYLREQAEAGFIKRNVPMFDMAYLSLLLSASDAVISPMSTLLIEALILEKPTMAIAFGDGKHAHNPSVTAQMTHFAELRGSAALMWCDSSDRLLKHCARLLRPGSRKKAAQTRRALLDRIVTTEPGTYAERLADFCRTTVEPAGRKLRGQRTADRRDTISHSYGAHLIARSYCRIHDGEPAVPGYWMHGWIPAYHNVHPALIALHKKDGQHAGYDFDAQIREEKEVTQQWVSRVDQAEYLIAHGYRHVKAIGLPIAYQPDPAVRRVPGSLLVMPPHSHKSHGPNDPLAERYADMIADVKPRFEHVWVGVNEDDMAKNQWVASFRRRGIDVFTTTDQADANTLVRLRRILSTFEHVTTNGFGSHIALAAYCGARVSVYGPYAEFPMERMKVTHAVKMFPQLLEQAHDLCTERALREHYPFLFVEPDRAMPAVEWGSREIGEPLRVSPEELRRLFGWSEPSPSPADRRSSVALPVALPTTGGAGHAQAAPSRVKSSLPLARPRVLFGMAPAGFFRNVEAVVTGLFGRRR